jgi:threonylcarbamoyladenosine tRNA methylthiotransferase MtaB
MSAKNNTTVISFGCRLNTYESEKIKQLLKENNINDVIVVNTCAVTSEAERQARQTIRKLKKEYPEKRIIVTGCAVTINKLGYARIADLVIPNESKYQIEHFAKDTSGNFSPQTTSLPIIEPGVLSGFEGKSRAFLQIQTGCDNVCSFCIVRIARGKSMSFPFEQILQQAKKFADQGYAEINLTGVNISSYKNEEKSLGNIIQLLLAKIPKHVKFRLSSLDPAAIDESLYEIMHEERVLPYWHLSLQSGDKTILSKMLRRHSPEDILYLTERIRSIRPRIVIGADVIVGFPGETNNMFENTVQLIRQCQISLLHVFPYSARPGTLAATLPNQVVATVKNARAKLMRDVGLEVLFDTMQRLLGQVVEVFIEKEIAEDNVTSLMAFAKQCNFKHYYGKTDSFLNIITCGIDIKIGQFAFVKIDKILDNGMLYGQHI